MPLLRFRDSSGLPVFLFKKQKTTSLMNIICLYLHFMTLFNYICIYDIFYKCVCVCVCVWCFDYGNKVWLAVVVVVSVAWLVGCRILSLCFRFLLRCIRNLNLMCPKFQKVVFTFLCSWTYSFKFFFLVFVFFLWLSSGAFLEVSKCINNILT